MGVVAPVVAVVVMLGEVLGASVWIIALGAGVACTLTVPVVAGVHSRHQRLRLEQKTAILNAMIENLRIMDRLSDSEIESLKHRLDMLEQDLRQ